MDHVPYPLTSDLPGLEIPLLRESKQYCLCHGIETGGTNASGCSNHICFLSRTTAFTASLKGDSQDPTNTEHDLGKRAAAKILDLHPWTTKFWDYPQEQGWITDNPALHWYHCSNAVAAARAQEWLYFRLLDSFLGVHVSIDTLSRRSASSGRMIIDSTMLPELIQRWESRAQGIKATDHEAGDETLTIKDGDTISRLLMGVIQACNNLDEHKEPSKSISFSIRILVEILAKAVWRASNDNKMERWTIWKLGPTSILTDRMANTGWCPFQITRLWYQYLPSTVYYLSSLPHRNTFGGHTHHTCIADHCAATRVNPITYEPQHRKSCCSSSQHSGDCNMVGVDTTSIANIILQGSIPLIEIRLQSDGSVALDVVPHENRLYVAISHVWSGGLGNARANSMRSCQLRYLYSLLLRLRQNGDDDLDRRQGARKIQDAVDDVRANCGFGRKRMPFLLWIDTLCIPVGSPHVIAYTKTLYRMAQIYITAQCVLVLDPELQHVNHRTMQKEQVFAHILCSAWMSRSWTFQEACMARIFLIQFNDGYFVVDQQYFELKNASEKLKQKAQAVKPETTLAHGRPAMNRLSTSHISLLQDVTRWFREMPVVLKIRNRDPRELMSKLDDWKNFALAWNALRNRSTTKPEDLYGILAVVVDLGAGDILKLPPQERLKTIYCSQSTLPLSLLYQPSPKIHNEHGRDTWAPSGIKGERLDLQSGYFSTGSQGLLIDPRQWIELSPPQAILIASAPTTSRYLDIVVDETQSRRTVELLLGDTSLLREIPSCSLCCIIDDSLAYSVPGDDMSVPGACLIIHSQKDFVYQASYLCPIKASLIHPRSRHFGDLTDKTPIPEVVGSTLDWRKYSIAIANSLASWPIPVRHLSKRSASKLVLIRNISIWCQLSYNAITQGPYLVGVGVSSAHRDSLLGGKLFWLFLSRWLAIAIESVWEAAVLFLRDHRRNMRWSDTLYGTREKSRTRLFKDLSQYPVFVFKMLTLIAALVMLSLSISYGQRWMKIITIILFTDFGLSSAYVLLLIYLTFKFANGQYTRAFTLDFFSDLPEDPFQAEDHLLESWERETRPDVDHRYAIARLVWRFVGYIRRIRRGSKPDVDRE
ncbi:MAG: hypothetical protein L6R41_001615 [Letrouitia leprolyta]|nr:MAG: hypothetical protein L6R41_001615 [Letrouitia leprolyta]